MGIHPLDGTYWNINPVTEEFNIQRQKAVLPVQDFMSLGYSTPPYNRMFSNVITYKTCLWLFDLYYALKGVKQYSTSFIRFRSDVVTMPLKVPVGADVVLMKGMKERFIASANRPTEAAEMEKLFATTDSVYRSDFVSLNNIQLTYTVDTNAIQELFQNNTFS